MKTLLPLLAATLSGQIALAQLYCNEVPNGGFENGCGTYVTNCSSVGGTGWTYYSTDGAPTMILSTATGTGCGTFVYTSNMGVDDGGNPPTWNGSPANEHYVTIRNSATDGNIRQRGVYTQLVNPLVAGAEYRFRARYNYRSIVGPGSYARIYLRMIDNGEFGCTSYGSWYTHDGASWQITSSNYQEEWLTLEGTFTATGNEAGVAVHAMFKNINSSQSTSVRLYVDAVELYQVSSCPGDFDGNGFVNSGDQGAMTMSFGQYVDSAPCLVSLDLNDDGVINVADLVILLDLFGTECEPEPCTCACDLDLDGTITQMDLDTLMSLFGQPIDSYPCLYLTDQGGDQIVNSAELGFCVEQFSLSCGSEKSSSDPRSNGLTGIPLEVYPNPATDKLFCTLTDVQGAEWAEVISLRGEVVLRQRITDQNLLTLDIADLAKGTYLMRLMTTSGERSSIFVKE